MPWCFIMVWYAIVTWYIIVTWYTILTCAAFSKASARERLPTKQYLWRHFLLFSPRTFAGARFAERSNGVLLCNDMLLWRGKILLWRGIPLWLGIVLCDVVYYCDIVHSLIAQVSFSHHLVSTSVCLRKQHIVWVTLVSFPVSDARSDGAVFPCFLLGNVAQVNNKAPPGKPRFSVLLI